MRFTPLTSALIAAVSPLVFIAPLGLVLLIVAAILIAAIVDALTLRRPPRGERQVGPFARGVPTPLRIRIEPGPASKTVIRQPLPPDVRSPRNQVDGPTLETTLLPIRRGLRTLAPVAVRRDGPMRLGRWHHEVGVEVPVRVYPDLPAAHRIANSVRQRSIRMVGQRRRGPLGLGTEFESVREYRTDDDVRQINWRATARLGRAMSNNLRVEQDLDVWVLVDAGRLGAASMRLADPSSHRGQEHEATGVLVSRVDLYLDAAAAVGLVADDLGDRLGFVAFADRVLCHASPRRRGGTAAIERSFDVEAHVLESDYEAAFASMNSARRALVLLFTDLVDPAAATGLAAALPVLTRRHKVTVITPDDPAFIRARTTGNDTTRLVVGDIDASATAAASLLKAAGATVIRVMPDRIAEMAARTYLCVRAGGSAERGLAPSLQASAQ